MSLLYDKVLRTMASKKLPPYESRMIKNMAAAHVFDASNLIFYDKDPNRQLSSVEGSIPIMPPYERTYIEWPQELIGEDGEAIIRSICGVTIVYFNPALLTEDDLDKLKSHAGHDSFAFKQMQSGNANCTFFCFIDVKYTRIESVPLGLCFDGMGMFVLDASHTNFEQIYIDEADGKLFQDFQHARYQPDGNLFHPVTIPLVALETIQLLNCKNITQQEHVPPSKLQRATVRRGHPPLCTYKTLKVNIPGQINSNATSTSEGNGVRFHLVRGHFKNLQHARFATKGWHWWPSHARGNPSFGSVEKDYKLTTEEINQPPPTFASLDETG